MTWSSEWLDAPAVPRPPAVSWTPAQFEAPPEPALETGEGNAVVVIQPVDLVALQEAARENERAAAYEQGYDEGVAAGRAEEVARLGACIAALESAIAAVQKRQAVPDDMLHDHVLAVSLAAARHIIAREIRGDQEAIADLVRRAIAEFPLDESVRIRVNPRDLSTLSTVSSSNGGMVRIAPGRNVQWIPDAQLQTGECIVEGRQRIVDGRIDRALERIYHQLSHA